MGDVIRYIGTANQAAMSEEDWAKAGVPGHDPIIWSRFNSFEVDTERLSADAQAAMLQDPRFVLIRGGEPTSEPDAADLAAVEDELRENSSTEDGYGLDPEASVDKDNTVFVQGEPADESITSKPITPGSGSTRTS